MATVNIGRAKTEFSRLIARVEAGEEIDIARDGVPVVRLVPVRTRRPGACFREAAGGLKGRIRVGDDFEFTDAELDVMLNE